MGRAREGNSYRSPQRKLVRFFEKSRDKWKAKARGSKRIIKRFKNRVSFLERSKENWKRKAEKLADELAKMKAEKIAKEKELEALEKAKKESSSLSCIGVFALTISGHQYSVGHIVLIYIVGVIGISKFSMCKPFYRDYAFVFANAFLCSLVVCRSSLVASSWILQTDARKETCRGLDMDCGPYSPTEC